jgi:protein phosphatase
MKIEIAARTDLGRVRERNEDAFLVLPEQRLALVCDGMGGHRAGEVASRGAVTTIKELANPTHRERLTGLFFSIDQKLPPAVRQLVSSLRVANRRIYNAAQGDLSLRGMGTTVVAALCDSGGCAIGHVGDSRAYLFRGGVIHRLTSDHSWLAELIAAGELTVADEHSFAERNVITRSLGTRPVVKIDLRWDPVEKDDLILLCSDGLSGHLKDPELLKVITAKKKKLEAVVEQLIKKANEAGGEDNITCALIRVVEADSTPVERFQGTVPEESDGELTVEDQIIQSILGGKKLQSEVSFESTDAIRIAGKSKKKKFSLFS